MKKEHLFVAVKTCKKFHGERGASPLHSHHKTLFTVQIAFEGLLSSCFLLVFFFCFFLVNGLFSFVISVCL